MKRVYHPNLDSFQDVPDSDVEQWAGAGWLKSPGKAHTSADSYPTVGDHPGFATIPVLEDTSPEVTTTAPRAARAARASRATRSGGTGSSVGSTTGGTGSTSSGVTDATT